MEEEKFIDVEKIISSKNPTLLNWLPGFIVSYLKKILHQNQINKFLSDNKNNYNQDFCLATLELLKAKVEIIGKEKIPKEGKIVLVMNHPLGGMDAMALVSALKGHREDLKFIVNDILLHLKNLNDIFLGVNKHGRNGLSIKQQLDDLFSKESAVCIFPAGLVSRKIDGEVMDLEWKKSFISLSKQHERTIIPIYIDGHLSPFFYRLSKIRKKLGIKANIEMLYLSNEFFKLKGQNIRIIVGDSITPSFLNEEKNDRKLANLVKDKVYELKKRL
jgi:1-acyl-sn-glycerol-3-phosphate acyltransferase